MLLSLLVNFILPLSHHNNIFPSTSSFSIGLATHIQTLSVKSFTPLMLWFHLVITASGKSLNAVVQSHTFSVLSSFITHTSHSASIGLADSQSDFNQFLSFILLVISINYNLKYTRYFYSSTIYFSIRCSWWWTSSIYYITTTSSWTSSINPEYFFNI